MKYGQLTATETKSSFTFIHFYKLNIMKLKFKLSIVALFSICLGTYSYGQIRLAPEVGANLSNYTSKYEIGNSTYSNSSQYLLGARAGLALDLGITDHIAIQPGFYYNLARTKNEVTFLGSTFTETTDIHGFQLPVYAMLRTGGSDSGHLFVGVGPVFNWNLSGTTKGNNIEREMDFGNDSSDDLRSFELGASATVGFKLQMGAFVRAYYHLGLSNLSPIDDNNSSIRSNSFGLSLGFYF